jgi:hypothetical protein
MNTTAKRLAELAAKLVELGELKSRSLAMPRPQYAQLEAEENAVREEYRKLLDAEAP